MWCHFSARASEIWKSFRFRWESNRFSYRISAWHVGQFTSESSERVGWGSQSLGCGPRPSSEGSPPQHRSPSSTLVPPSPASSSTRRSGRIAERLGLGPGRISGPGGCPLWETREPWNRLRSGSIGPARPALVLSTTSFSEMRDAIAVVCPWRGNGLGERSRLSPSAFGRSEP